jgi:hypothetical protein
MRLCLIADKAETFCPHGATAKVGRGRTLFQTDSIAVSYNAMLDGAMCLDYWRSGIAGSSTENIRQSRRPS